MAVPVLILGVIIFDSSFVLIRRFIKGRNLFVGDLEHTYNIIFNKVKSQRKAVLFICLVNVLLGLFSLFLLLKFR